MIFLAGQISSPQCSELAIVLEQHIQISSYNHVQVDIEFAALNAAVEESDFSPPPFPALLKLLNCNILMQAICIISKAIESDFPWSIAFDARIEFIDVVCIISNAPFNR